MAGATLAARVRNTPVVLDGFVVCSAAAILKALDPTAIDHCLAGHASAERAHRAALGATGASGRSSTSACGSAKGPARRSRSA